MLKNVFERARARARERERCHLPFHPQMLATAMAELDQRQNLESSLSFTHGQQGPKYFNDLLLPPLVHALAGSWTNSGAWT